MIFEDEDTIIRLPSDPEGMEAHLKTLPTEVLEGFAASLRREGKTRQDNEMNDPLQEIIVRLARVNQEDPNAAKNGKKI
jgi:hypothetical protein